jgi:hypothetical protein
LSAGARHQRIDWLHGRDEHLGALARNAGQCLVCGARDRTAARRGRRWHSRPELDVHLLSDQRVGPSFFNSIKGDGLTFFFLAVV